MTINEMQQEIIRLKKENDICILAHAYQDQSILEVADYVGDSFALAKNAREVPQKKVLMCGVRFMAETVKILSPEKEVLLSHEEAGCPMAEQMSPEEVKALKEKYPDHKTVCYINTTAELKTLCDVCVTSSAAMKIVSKMDADRILFIPDPNLGGWIADQLPEKEFVFGTGGCPVHEKITEEEAKAAKEAHPEALLLVHPECKSGVVAQADYVGSTTGIMDFAKKSDQKEFIIGTENSIVEHLQAECPDKVFYPMSKCMLCENMRLTHLGDVYAAVKGRAEVIDLPEDVRTAAAGCIEEMLRLNS